MRRGEFFILMDDVSLPGSNNKFLRDTVYIFKHTHCPEEMLAERFSLDRYEIPIRRKCN